jgi:hypothetical protein
MADVIKGVWTPGLTYLRPDGITSLKIKATGDAAFYPVGNIESGKLTITPQDTKDTLGRPHVYGYLVEGTVPSIQASAVEIKAAVAAICNAPNGVHVQFTDGLYMISPETAALLSLKFKASCDGDANGHRKIEYMLRGFVKIAEGDALVVSSETNGTPTGGDKLYSLNGGPILADEVPNGLSQVGFCVQGDSGYQNFGDFRDGKWTLECVGDDGGGGRRSYRTTGLKFTFDAIGLETDDAKLNLLDTVHQNLINLQLTHMDGAILTLTNAYIGTTLTLAVEGGADKTRQLKIHSEGIIPISDPSSFTTTFNALWS